MTLAVRFIYISGVVFHTQLRIFCFFIKVNPQPKFILWLLPQRFFMRHLSSEVFSRKIFPLQQRLKNMKALNCTLLKSRHPHFSVSCVDFLRHKMWSDISYWGYIIQYILYSVYIKSIGGFPPVLFPTLKNRTSPNYFQWKLIRKSFTFYTKLFLVLVQFNSECAHAIKRVM